MKLDELLDWYADLTPETVDQLSGLYHEQARFRDPFNDVTGHHHIAAIFRHMFATSQDPRFLIEQVQVQGDTAWVSWRFRFGLSGRQIEFPGATRLDFGEDGRVLQHRDYWDSKDLFRQIPLLRRLMLFLENKLKTPA